MKHINSRFFTVVCLSTLCLCAGGLTAKVLTAGNAAGFGGKRAACNFDLAVAACRARESDRRRGSNSRDCKSTKFRQASCLPDLSGMAWLGGDRFLAVHDAKTEGESNRPRASLIELPAGFMSPRPLMRRRPVCLTRTTAPSRARSIASGS